MAQQGSGRISQPKQKSEPAVSANVLVTCDLACSWKLDGKARGSIAAGDSTTAPLSLGQHLVVATTMDGVDKIEKEVDVNEARQVLVRFALGPVRDARLQGKRTLPSETTSKPDLRDYAVEQFKDGAALYDQKRYWEASPLLQNACDGGELNGCSYLGFLYESSLGVSQDYAQARTLYQKACDGGNMRGCSNLGSLYDSGHGVIQDYARARSLYQEACDVGESLGCNNLGSLYDTGHGVSQDYAQARALYQKACDGGEMLGCYNLGDLYQEGQGVTQDYAEARVLYQKACKGGDMGGCSNLGSLYVSGLGVSQNPDQARQLYQEACDGGYMDACDWLRKLTASSASVRVEPTVHNVEPTVHDETEKIRIGPHAQMPPAQRSATSGTVWGTTTMTVQNSTPYELTVFYDGPVSKKLILAPGASQVVNLAPGAFHVAGRVSAPDVLPFYGEESYDGSASYSETFYIR
jgi:TPR repeat protein